MSQALSLRCSRSWSEPPIRILSNHKAISEPFPYAIRPGQRGDEGKISTVLSAARTSGSRRFIWHHAGPYITELFNEPTPSPEDHRARFTLCTLEWQVARYSSGLWVGGGSVGDPVLGGGWSKCGRHAIANCIHRLPASTYSQQRLDLVEEAAAPPTPMPGMIPENRIRHCSLCSRTRRHRNTQVILPTRLVGAGLRRDVTGRTSLRG